MTLRALLYLAWRDVWAARGRFTMSVAGIATACMLLSLVLAFGIGVRDAVLRQVALELPIDSVEVQPQSFDLGIFKLNPETLLGRTPLDDAALRRLRAMPEVLRADEKVAVQVPMGAQGGQSLFGRRLYVDLFMSGLAAGLVPNAAALGFVPRDDFVPVVISPQLIELYNASVAPALGTPALSEDALRGFCFDLQFGRSLMLGSHGARRVGVERACIVGTSVHAVRLGVSTPLPVAIRLSRTYGADEPPSIRSVVLKLRRATDLGTLSDALQSMGLRIDETAQKTRHLFAVVTGLGVGGCGVLLMFCGLGMAQTLAAQLQARQKELAIMRSVGATVAAIWGLVVTQATLVGLVGGLLGTGFARLLAWGLEALLHASLPSMPLLPQHVFGFALWQGLVTLGGAVLTAIVAGTPPALAAAKRPLPMALS